MVNKKNPFKQKEIDFSEDLFLYNTVQDEQEALEDIKYAPKGDTYENY